MVWIGDIWYGLVPYVVDWCRMVRISAMWCCMVWTGAVWYGLVIYGMDWCRMLWIGAVW